MAALAGNFLLVTNVENLTALPLVLPDAIGKGSEHSGCAICPLCGWPASVVGTALLEGNLMEPFRKLGQANVEY